LAEDGVDEEDRADDDERYPDGATRRVQQQQNANAAEDGFDRNAVPDVEETVTGDETVPAEEQIEGRDTASQGDQVTP